MPAIRYSITLTPEERGILEPIVAKGNSKARKTRQALILLNCDKQGADEQPRTNNDIADFLGVHPKTVERTKRTFVEEGLTVALNGRRGSRSRAKKLDGDAEAHLVTIACSAPPKGAAKWTLRLLADRLVELEIVDSISYETVRRKLKKTNSNLGNVENG